MLNNQTKKCTKCQEIKDINLFRNHSNCVGGKYSQCKTCEYETKNTRRRTKKGLVTSIICHQRDASIKRGHKPPHYSHSELSEWLLSHSDYDRLEYSFSNIRLVTWKENMKYAGECIKNCIKEDGQRRVTKYNMDMEAICSYFSISEACRDVGTFTANICKCCTGDRSHTLGFKWRYA